MRNRAATAVITAAVLLLSGCASIPKTGAVQDGITIDNSGSVQVDILARGPQIGDSQQQILDGFLAAAASPQLDYRIAREFLTPNLSKQWKPDSGSTVDHADQRSSSATGGSSIALRIKPIATISDQGVYTASRSGAAETRNYSFEQVDGEWRIATAPQGIVIDQPTFGVVWGTYDLQFISPNGLYLVPDVRFFARRENTQTAIVRTLLAGPVSWLANGVTTAVPVGTRLDADSVPVSNGTATVNLAVDTVPSPDLLARIHSQLLSSLVGVSGVTAVALEINGTAENQLPNTTGLIAAPKVDVRPAVLTADGFGYLSLVSGQLEPFAFSAGVAALAPHAVTLGVNAGFAAVLGGTGSVYRVGSTGTVPAFTGTGWIAPGVDPSGGIWSARSATSVFWQAPDGGAAEFATGWGDAAVTAVAISRDGTRIAAVLRTGSLTRVVVSAISRGGDDSPTAIGEPVVVAEIDESGPAGGALAWLDPTTLGVLSGSIFTTAVVGAQAVSSAAPNGAVTVAAGNLAHEVRVRTAENELLLQSGAGWQSRAAGVLLLAQQTGLR